MLEESFAASRLKVYSPKFFELRYSHEMLENQFINNIAIEIEELNRIFYGFGPDFRSTIALYFTKTFQHFSMQKLKQP